MKSPSLIPVNKVTPILPRIEIPFDGVNKPEITLKAAISDYVFYMKNNRVCGGIVHSVLVEIGVRFGGIFIKYYVSGLDNYMVERDFELTRQALLDTL